MGRSNQDRWQPALPDAADAAGAYQGTDSRFDSFPYTPAPPSSHLKEFRFVAASAQGRVLAQLNQYQSFLHVVFRETDTSPETEYEYRFPSESEGRAYFDKMSGHSEPGKVVWEMRRAGVRYKPLR